MLRSGNADEVQDPGGHPLKMAFPAVREPGRNTSLAAGLLDVPSCSGWEKLSRFLQCFATLRASDEREKMEKKAKTTVEN